MSNPPKIPGSIKSKKSKDLTKPDILNAPNVQNVLNFVA